MNLSDHKSLSPQKYLTEQLSGVKQSVIDHALAVNDELHTRIRGKYLFDSEWDLAIILDALRYDVAKYVSANHSIDLGLPECVYSVGSMSIPWLEHTLSEVPENIQESTIYISANPHINKHTNSSFEIDPVWDYGWDEEQGIIPPRSVTDRTIKQMRRNSGEKYVAHYMQPHLPVVETDEYETQSYHPFFTSGTRWENNTWKRIRDGDLSPEPVIEGYLHNTRYILSEIELLLENVDASKVIITADHGNYLGERGRWGHPINHTHSAVRHVPWWVTNATDTGSHSPDSHRGDSNTSHDAKLKALGYK